MDPQLVLRDRLVSYPLGTLRNDSSEGVTEKAATPWTEEPFCLPGQDAEQALCVYTDADFAQGRGISLITSQSSAQQVSKHTAFNYPEQLEEGNRALNDVYEVRPLKDRGFGLVAKGKLGRGTRIFSHTPVIAAQLAAEKLPDEELFPLLQVAVQRLPNETRKKFMALHGHFGGDEIYDKFQTNGFRVFDYAAVFPETSRLNHDCRPNAHFYFDIATFTHHVNAIRDIEPGEEITISYISHYLSHEQRTGMIHHQWGFNCSCAQCSASRAAIQTSDQRLQRIQTLEDHLEDLSRTRIASVAMAKELIALYEQEELYAPIAQAYAYAALENVYTGNSTGARHYASQSMEAAELWRGPRSREVQAMRNILDGPEFHERWMYLQGFQGL